jgi:4-diphosphocytidyl-2-C-methyl-D-erythritol kinase
MLLRRSEAGVLVWAPAKVNLFLEVLQRRTDGYHELTTLMLAVSLFDVLELKDDPGETTRLQCSDESLSTGPDNLVYRAAELLRQRSGCRRGVSLRLWKRIPMAAGLAGGSSDAAATLAGLSCLWQLGLSQSELAVLGAELGSDVAFFFATPAAWCTGRGERVQPVALGRPLDLVLVCPPVGLSTAQVFRSLTVPQQPLDGCEIRRAVMAGACEEVGRLLHNRLQATAENLCPEVGRCYQRLQSLRPAGQLMSGSGSTVFALCRGPADALRLARELRSFREERDGSRVYIVRSSQ